MMGMLVTELKNVLYALLYGAVLTCAYDVIKNIRCFIRHNTVAVSVEDLLFWLTASITTIILLIKINDGIIRMYLIAGSVFGAVIYKETVHLLLKKLCILITIKINRRKRGGRIAERRKKI